MFLRVKKIKTQFARFSYLFCFIFLIDFFQILIMPSILFASENAGVEIDFGDIAETNIDNIKDKGLFYKKGIIEKVKEGRSLDYKMGKPMLVKNFFFEDYCQNIGEYSIIGTVPYPTWCNENQGPFSMVRNPLSAIVIPITAELKKGFKLNLNEKLENDKEANYVGVIRGHHHNPTDLTGPNFKYDQDMLLGLVNESQKRMMIWNISNVGIYRNSQKVNNKTLNSFYDLGIDLFNKKGELIGGVSFGEDKKNCSHHKKCLFDKIHLLEYRNTIHTPKVVYTKNWGYVTGKAFPIHTLIEDHGSMKKLFFSRNYYLIVDITLDELKQLGRVKHRVIPKN